MNALCSIAFGELAARRIELGVYPDNVRALRTYLRCGFRREARLRSYIYHDGAWRDIAWMSMLRGERPTKGK